MKRAEAISVDEMAIMRVRRVMEYTSGSPETIISRARPEAWSM